MAIYTIPAFFRNYYESSQNNCKLHSGDFPVLNVNSIGKILSILVSILVFTTYEYPVFDYYTSIIRNQVHNHQLEPIDVYNASAV